MKRKLLMVVLFFIEIAATHAQRDPLKWPFSKYSIWNVPIHNNAIYVEAKVQPAANFEADEDVIVLTPNEPLMDVKTNYSDWKGNLPADARCSDQGPTIFSAPIPESFIYSNATWHGRTPNAGLAVLMPNGKIKQTQPFAKCSPTLATSHYQWDENQCVLTGECIVGAHGGSGLSAIGGALRVGELSSGEIKHVLKINLWGKENFYNGNNGFRWPAVKADGGFNDASHPNYYSGTNPEMGIGALLAIHKDVVLQSLSNNGLNLETEAGLIIARALQNYGAYTVDNTAGDTYAIITETGPNGRVSDEFKAKFGFDMNLYGGLENSAWGRDLKKIFGNLFVITNNSEGNVGGGPTQDVNRRAPFACDFGTQGSGFMCSQVFKVMPLGDSKTEGDFNRGGQHSWRGYLRSKLVSNNYKIDYVGDRVQRAAGDVEPYDNEHSGHGGYTIGPDTQIFPGGSETTGTYEHIGRWLPDANPDIVIVALGVNDMFSAENHPANYAATAPQRYQDLVDKILQLKPSLKLILCTVEPVKWSKDFSAPGSALGNLNAKIRAIANASSSDNIYLAEVHDEFMSTYSADDFADDVHLNQQGATKVANTIYNTLIGVLQGSGAINQYPSVNITAPVNQTVVAAPANIVIEANATDADGTISKVEFYNGTSFLGSDNTAPFSFTWTNVTGGSYTLKAKAVDNVGAATTSAGVNIAVNTITGNTKLTGTAIGTPGSYNSNGLTLDKAMDGDLTTYFDGPAANDQWVGLDLGLAKIVREIKYCPREKWSERMKGGRIQGANNSDFSDAVDLYTISTVPPENLLTQVLLYDTTPYQYIRYLSPTNGYGNVAEIQFFTKPTDPSSKVPVVNLVSPATGGVFNYGAAVDFSATASDSDGTISRVEFYEGKFLIGSATSSPYNFSWKPAIPGTYSVYAKAVDNSGVGKISQKVSLSVSAPTTTPLYAESFDSKTFTGWVPSGGIWTAANSSYERTEGNGEVTSIYNTTTFTSYLLSMEVKPIWDNNVGVIFNYVDANNYYVVILNSKSKTAEFRKKVSGAMQTLGTASFTGTGTGTKHLVSIHNSNGMTTIRINDLTVFNKVSTTEQGSGKIGVYSYWTPVQFDNITISAGTSAAPVSDNIAFNNPPLVVNVGGTYTVKVDYSATAKRVIEVYLYNSKWEYATRANVNVSAGSGTANVVLTIPATTAPSVGGYYTINYYTESMGSFIKSTSKDGITINGLPTVGITSPTNNSSYTGPTSISIEASATDNDGLIAKVEFYNGSALLGSATTNPYKFTWTNVAVGSYTLTAKAIDNRGAVASSSAVAVKVDPVVNESVSFNTPPMTVSAGSTYSVKVNYACTTIRILDVYLYNSSWQKIASVNVPVSAGSGLKEVSITVPSNTAALTGGIWAVNMWTSNWSSVVKSSSLSGVTVTKSASSRQAFAESEVVLDQVSVHPNPAAREVNISYNCHKKQQVEILITDELQYTKISKSEAAMAGINTSTINVTGLSNGMYLLQLIVDGQKTVRKIIINK